MGFVPVLYYLCSKEGISAFLETAYISKLYWSVFIGDLEAIVHAEISVAVF